MALTSKDYEILVNAGLNKDQSYRTIKNDVTTIEQKIAKEEVRIKATLNPTSVSKIQSQVSKIGTALNLDDGVLQQFDVLSLGTNKYGQEIAKIAATYEDAHGRMVKVTQELNLTNESFTGKAKLAYKELTFDTQKYQDRLEDIEGNMGSIVNNILPKFKLSPDELTAANKAMQDLATQRARLEKAVASDAPEREFKDIAYQAGRAQKQLQLVSNEARAGGKWAMNFGEKLKQAVTGFSLWQIVTNAFFLLKQAIRDAITSIIELDDALVELNKVANLTNIELETMKKQAFEVASGIGAVGTEVINATADFARMGFEANEALGLAETALIFKNVGDGIDSVDDATKTIITTLKGFNMEASEATHVIDALNEVSNTYATDSGDLATALQTMSATMAQSGTGFEESLALFTSAQEVMQNASKASTGLVTISQRLRGLEDAAEDGEDFTNFTAKLQQSFKDIANIDIMEDGKLRSTYDIMVDMAEVQHTLTEEQKQYLGELAAGKRQIKVWNSILQNTETLTKAVSVATDSQNSALEENQKVVESISGKINIFRNELQKLWDNTINSDFIKWVVDLGTSAVKLADSLGVVNVALVAFLGLLFSIKGAAIVDTISLMATAIGVFALEVQAGNFSLKAFSVSTWEAVVASEAFKASITFGVSLAVAALALVIGNAIKVQRNYRDKIDNTKASMESFEDKVKLATDALNKFNETGDKVDLQTTVSEIDSAKKALQELIDVTEYYDTVSRIQGIEDQIQDFRELQTTASPAMYQVYETKIKELENALSPLRESTLEVADAQRDLNSVVEQSFWQLERAGYGLEGLADANDEVRLAQEGLNDKYIESYETMQNYATSLEDVADLKDRVNSGTKIEVSEIISLISKYPQLANNIVHVNDSKEAGLGLAKSIFAVEKEQYRQKFAAQKVEYENQRKIINQKLDDLKVTTELLEANAYATIMEDPDAFIRFANLQNQVYQITKQINAIDLANGVLDDVTWSNLSTSVEDGATSLKEVYDITSALMELEMEKLENSQESLNNLLDKTVDLIRQRKEDEKDILEMQKEALDISKEQYEFSKKQAEIGDEMSDIETKIAEISMDTSREGNILRQQLEEELLEKKSEMDELVYDKSVDVQEDALDKQIDNIDKYLSEEGSLISDAMEELNRAFSEEGSDLMGELIKWNQLYGTSIESDITSAWKSASSAMESYRASASGTATFGEALNSISKDLSDSEIIEKMAERGQQWKETEDTDLRNELASANEADAKKLSFDVYKKNGTWYNTSTGLPIYDNGGRFQGEGLEPVLAGGVPETMITDTQMPSFLKEALNVAIPKINYDNIPTVSGGTNNYFTITGNSFDSNDRVKQVAKEVAKQFSRNSKRRG